MRKKLLLLGVLFIAAGGANSQNVQWAVSPNSTKSNGASGISSDAAGAIYVNGTLTYPDSIYFGSTPLTIVSGQAGYLARYNSAGINTWAVKSIKGTASAVSGSDVYLAGPPDAPFGGVNIQIAKYDAATGNSIWLKQTSGSNGANRATGIVADNSGGLFISGRIGTTVTFDTIIYTKPYSGNEAYLAKYDTSGAVQWLVKAYGPGNDYATCLARDASSRSIYFAGEYEDSLFIGTEKIASAGAEEIFVAKVDASGKIQWLKSAGGTSTDRPTDITTDAAGNIYVAGVIRNNTNFGAISVNGSGYRRFVAKYDASGNEQWVATITNGAGSSVKVITKNNEIFVTGGFSSSIDFEGSSFSLSTPSVFDGNIFVARLDNSGSWVSAVQFGDTGAEDAADVELSTSGNLLIAGSAGRSDNGPGTINFGGISLNIGNQQDILLAEIGLASGIGQNGYSAFPVAVYPNPAASLSGLTLQLPQPGNYTLRIYDVSGKEIFSQSLDQADKMVLSGKGIAPGKYIYRITDTLSGENKAAGKLVITE